MVTRTSAFFASSVGMDSSDQPHRGIICCKSFTGDGLASKTRSRCALDWRMSFSENRCPLFRTCAKARQRFQEQAVGRLRGTAARLGCVLGHAAQAAADFGSCSGRRLRSRSCRARSKAWIWQSIKSARYSAPALMASKISDRLFATKVTRSKPIVVPTSRIRRHWMYAISIQLRSLEPSGPFCPITLLALLQLPVEPIAEARPDLVVLGLRALQRLVARHAAGTARQLLEPAVDEECPRILFRVVRHQSCPVRAMLSRLSISLCDNAGPASSPTTISWSPFAGRRRSGSLRS